MWPPATPVMRLAGWLAVLLPAVYADSVIKLYKKEGDEVVLKPGNDSVTGPITSIIWKDGANIAIQWDGTETDSYRQFTERGSLNPSNGEMTITGLTRDDSGLYTAEVNNNDVKSPAVLLIIISPVPQPTVSQSCDEEKTSCTLTCDGDTTLAEPVTYRWKSGDTVTAFSKEQYVTKEDHSSVNEFRCELQNPVSQQSSPAVPNPLVAAAPGGALNISTGLAVFVGLLAAVLLLVAIHRLKAGMWFYQKTSMPWEADFWRKHERPPRDAAESNGATAQENGQTDEETPMTGSQTTASQV